MPAIFHAALADVDALDNLLQVMEECSLLASAPTVVCEDDEPIPIDLQQSMDTPIDIVDDTPSHVTQLPISCMLKNGNCC